ncbi:imidazole glycerol phosphate synthase subunit HisH [SAR202 cluster bacterium AD-802-E10_MRT_200m]|nr:imidazole glycerol phosphate synthase subunit HisH [SAR202 cluster bacterium AD-802-E10_MRT_200m]
MSKFKIMIIDYGAGNVHSVAKALEFLGAKPLITNKAEEIEKADALIFPGQGACAPAMKTIDQSGLTGVIKEAIFDGKPFLGICVGLQLLFDTSQEGETQCFGIVPGRIRLLPADLKVPHMGWNRVHVRAEHPVFDKIPQDSYFYFVHSYYPDPLNQDIVMATTEYGFEFCCAIAHDNLVATQFHPEKSGVWGLKLYENFLRFASGE